MALNGGIMRAKIAGLPVPLVVVGGVAVGYLLYSRYKKAGASQNAATAAGTSSASSGASPDQQTAAAIFQSQQQQAEMQQQMEQTLSSDLSAQFASLEAQIAQMFPQQQQQQQPAPTPSPTPTATNTTPPPQPGGGIVQTALGPMVWLGVWGQPHYNVGGGAPVYFGNAQNLQQGSQAEIPGNDIYTPVAYAGLVSSGVSS